MDAEITGENDERVGLYVYDNNDVEHWIEIEFDGEIKYHEQDGYPDNPNKRTSENNEHVEQARKYARYYVYVQRGYDTVPPAEHPERINAVRLAVQKLDDDEFENLFGDLYKQMRSYHDYDTERPIPEPPNAADSVLYRQNVYLGINPLETNTADQARDLAHEHGLDLSAETILEQSIQHLSDAEIADWTAFTDDLTELSDEPDIDPDEAAYIDAVSSLYATYLDHSGQQYTTDPETDPFDRDPDTILELPPIDPESMADFREFLHLHLNCQIRDCFVRMGVEPPEQFRVLGNGRLEAVAAYKLLDMYPEFHDPETETLLP